MIERAMLTWRDGFVCEIGDQVVRADHERTGWLIWGCCAVGERKVGLRDPHGIKRWCLPDCFIMMISAQDVRLRNGGLVQYDINLEPLKDQACYHTGDIDEFGVPIVRPLTDQLEGCDDGSN